MESVEKGNKEQRVDIYRNSNGRTLKNLQKLKSLPKLSTTVLFRISYALKSSTTGTDQSKVLPQRSQVPTASVASELLLEARITTRAYFSGAAIHNSSSIGNCTFVVEAIESKYTTTDLKHGSCCLTRSSAGFDSRCKSNGSCFTYLEHIKGNRWDPSYHQCCKRSATASLSWQDNGMPRRMARRISVHCCHQQLARRYFRCTR